jgi:hypothetical protein
MARSAARALPAVLLLLGPALAAAGAGAGDGRLSVADVEKVTGLKGIRLAPHDPSKGAGGDLNFADAGGQLVLMVVLEPGESYGRSKQTKGYYRQDVPDIGEEAFAGPALGPLSTVLFRKGTRCVGVSTYLALDSMGKRTVLPFEQVLELARLIASRL